MDRSVPKAAQIILLSIYKIETGKNPPECYEVIFGNRQTGLAKPITQMALDEVEAAQATWSTKAWAAKFESTVASSAAGAEDDPARRDVLAAAAAETMGLAGRADQVRRGLIICPIR